MDIASEELLDETLWGAQERAYRDAIEPLIAPRIARKAVGEKDPTDDFIWDYYAIRMGRLKTWHPGMGVVLLGDAAKRWLRHRWYMRAGDGVTFDREAFVADRSATIERILSILMSCSEREPQFSCFCLHEWAMVYHLGEDERRHRLPLRLGSEGTDAVVDSHQIHCTHFDAFRYFAPDAVALNAVPLTPMDRTVRDHGGCLHVTMDLFSWAYKLLPAGGSALLYDALVLARRARDVDMAASPYLSPTPPIPIETPEGKAEFVSRQRQIASDAQVLRARLVSVCQELMS